MKNNKSIQNLEELKLSPGQALLIVIEKNQKRISKNARKLNEEEISRIRDYIKRLCLLYLSGVESKEDQQVFKKAMEDEALSGYYLSYDYDTIDEDPTRRYFETHLSALTLKYSLDKLDIKDLRNYYKLIYASLPEAEKININRALKYSTARLTGSFKEYISILKNLNPSLLYEEISELNQEKMRLLVEYALLGVRAVNNSSIKFPLDIYGFGLFYKENRGLKYKAWQYNVNSGYLGIMKSYMPLPKGDLAAYIDKPTAYLRSADNTTFDKIAKWPRVNFNKLTHPFSSSLSGTVLCQLRVINYFLEEANFKFDTTESLVQFMRCFISCLLYQAGGHSLHEFTKVLALPEVRKAFNKIQGFEKINEETLFFKENEKAFFEALDNTITYHTTLLARKRVHASLVLGDKNRPLKEEEKWDRLNRKLISEMENKYNFYIYDGLCYYLDEKFKEVEWIAQKNNLSIKDILYLKNIFLKRLNTIDFLKAYSNCEFKFQGRINLEITNESFSDYIHSEMIAPELADTEKFVKDNLFSSVSRDSYLKLIKNIKELIEPYQGDNKKAIVYLFNMNIELLASYIQETINPDIDCVKDKLIKYIEEIQDKENQHNNNLFFARNLRKSHSSLQCKINEAKAIINKFITDEQNELQGIKPKI